MSIGENKRLNEGLEAFARRDYDSAIEILHDLSLCDNAEALTYLAESIYRRTGFQEIDRIIKLRVMASGLGSLLASLRLGGYFSLIQSEFQKTREFFLKAAALGSNVAISRLGSNRLNTAIGYERYQTYLRAAHRGNESAMFEYARYMENGEVYDDRRLSNNPIKNWLMKNHERKHEAKRWYIEAALAGNMKVINHLMGTPQLLPGKEIMKDLPPAPERIEKGVKEGDPLALSIKGYWLLDRNNPEEAFSCLHKAAKKGNYYAMGDLGYLYYKGRGVNKSLEISLAWWWHIKKLHPQYALPVEDGDFLLSDVEEYVPLELCLEIRRNPQKFMQSEKQV